MRALNEKSMADMSDDEIRELLNQQKQDDAKEAAEERVKAKAQSQSAKPKNNTSQENRKSLQDYRERKLQFQMQQAKDRSDRLKELSQNRSDRLKFQMQQAVDRTRMQRSGFSLGGERVSERDTDPTATSKSIGNVATVVRRLAGLGIRAAANRMKRGSEDEKAKEEVKAKTKENVMKRREATQTSQARKGKAIQTWKTNNEEYEYSCWREEFLYELGDMRQQSKNKKNLGKDPVVDVMKGTNKITLNPTVSEATETPQDKFDRLVAASSKLTGSAKIKMLKYAASKHPKMNEEVMCDERASREPGKGTAEMVRDRMSKMFTNTPDSYSPMKISTLKAMAKKSRDK